MDERLLKQQVAEMATDSSCHSAVNQRHLLSQGKQVDERLPEQQVEEMATGMRRLTHAKPAAVTQFLLDCCVEQGYKVPTYAMLLGELHM